MPLAVPSRATVRRGQLNLNAPSVHDLDVCGTSRAVAERTSLDTGRYQRAIRRFRRREVAAVLDHVLLSPGR